MYKCQVTGEMSELGDKQHRIVVRTRDRVYNGKLYNEETRLYEDVVLGQGTEIVKEITASENGLLAWNAMSQQAQEALLKQLNIK